MSTRCQILVSGHDAVIYRHSDGYPNGKSGVLHDILPTLRYFKAGRGWDEFYLTAQLVGTLVAKQKAWAKRFCKEKYPNPEDRKAYCRELECLGLGVEAFDGELHGDIDYVYVVFPEHVEVREPTWETYDETPTLTKTKLAFKVNYAGKKIE
jgi:hypothetical protein